MITSTATETITITTRITITISIRNYFSSTLYHLVLASGCHTARGTFAHTLLLSFSVSVSLTLSLSVTHTHNLTTLTLAQNLVFNVFNFICRRIVFRWIIPFFFLCLFSYSSLIRFTFNFIVECITS